MTPTTVSLVVASVAGAVSVTSIFVSGLVAKRERDRERLTAAVETAALYREPLLRGAHDLQSRLWNIERKGFLDAYLKEGTEREQVYALESTLYLVAQYLAWVEIIRSAVLYLDPADPRGEAALVRRLDQVRHVFSTTSETDVAALRLFRSQQRAIGEVMMKTAGNAPRSSCLGFADFHERLGDPKFAYWFAVSTTLE
jgi:hypothetical protein